MNLELRTTATSAVKLEGVTRVFARTEGASLKALGPIDLEIREGEFFAIIGPSGCGKTTMLEIVAGLTKPSSGTIRLGDVEIAGEPPQGLSMVFQQDACLPWLDVYENIAFGLRRQRVARAEIDRRVQHALGLLGLSEFKRAYPVQLSGGMRQRVCIGRALVMRPKLILLDEPFGALDQQTRLLMGEELLKVWRDTGATVVLITHSLDEAAMLADRIGVMSSRPGRILEIVDTSWPRERDSRIAERPEFGKITTHLWSRLRDESIQAMTLRQGAAG